MNPPNIYNNNEIEELTIETSRASNSKMNPISNGQLLNKLNSNHNINNVNPPSDRLTDKTSDRNKINSLENIDEDHHALSERLKQNNNQVNIINIHNNNQISNQNKEISEEENKFLKNNELIEKNQNIDNLNAKNLNDKPNSPNNASCKYQ